MDEQKRKRIRQSKGAVMINMGKLGDKDVWHVWLNNSKEHLVVLGKPPEGARIMADGEGSAYRTTQRIGGRASFKPITHRFGAVRGTISPAATSKGARVSFAPTSLLTSVKRGSQYFTRTSGGATLISRRPLGGSRRRRR